MAVMQYHSTAPARWVGDQLHTTLPPTKMPPETTTSKGNWAETEAIRSLEKKKKTDNASSEMSRSKTLPHPQ
jgi:hypothetical protein